MDRKLINRRYRIERRIGEGAAAEVYLAHDSVLNRRVALKSLRPQFAADPGFRARFEREAQAAARFNHPNIIAIFDVGEDKGLPYIVMEYVDGDTLREIIDQEAPIHADDVSILVEQVAAALDYAHQRGLVHRDIKPHNILVDHQGLAKVVDFGIAKGLSDEALTDAAESIGTVQYISPEQASGLMATPESDIYSLAVVAFEMLTAALPFDSETAIGIAMRHVNDPAPDPTEVNPNIPHEVADIILRGLAKDPTQRFPTAGEFARVLTAWRSYTPEDWKAARVRASTGTFPRQAPAPISHNTAAFSPPAFVPPVQPQPLLTTKPTSSSPVAEIQPAPERIEQFDAGDSQHDDPVARSRKPGIGSWLASALVLAVVALLLWFGLGLGDRLTGGSSNDPAPTVQTAGGAKITTSAKAATVAPQVIAIPNVVGMTQPEATSALAALGLKAVIIDPVESGTFTKGAVVKQTPNSGGSAHSGDAISLNLSSGPPAVNLGALNLVGMTGNDAEALLTSRGFHVTRVQKGSKTIAAGAVIGVVPGDHAQPGDTLTLTVSAGDKIQIPIDLQGQNVEIVKSQLTKLGFVIAGTNGVSAETVSSFGINIAATGLKDGDVVGIQEPGIAFGGWVPVGTSITLNFYSASSAQPTVAPTK